MQPLLTLCDFCALMLLPGPRSAQIHMSFSHQYPSHLRAGVRAICGMLLIFTIVYVIPHLFDVGAPQSPVSSSKDAAAPVPPVSAFEDQDAVLVDEFGNTVSSAGARAKPRGGSGSGEEYPPTAPIAPFASVLPWSSPAGSLASVRLASEFERVLSWPWPWAWPWTSSPFTPNSRAFPAKGAPASVQWTRFGDDFDLDAVPSPSCNPRTLQCKPPCVDDELCARSTGSAEPRRANVLLAAADDTSLYGSRLYQVGGGDGVSTAAVWRQYDLVPTGKLHSSPDCKPAVSAAAKPGKKPRSSGGKPASLEGKGGSSHAPTMSSV